MKHNWLFKNLSDIGKIQQIHIHLLFFFAITDSNNTNKHTKTLNNTVNTQYNVYIMTWIWYNEKKTPTNVHVIAKI